MKDMLKQSLIDALIAFGLVLILERVLFPEPREPDVVYIILGDDLDVGEAEDE